MKTSIATFLLLAASLFAADAPAEKPNNRFIYSPLFFFTPETSAGFGVAGSYLFRLPTKLKTKSSRPSTLSPLFIYTLNKQFKFELIGNIYLKDENLQLSASLKILNYPNKFFGIGNSTVAEDKEKYTSQGSEFSFSLLRRLTGGLRLGAQYNYSQWEISDWLRGGLLELGDIPGSRHGQLSGTALLVNWDTRDNIFYPSHGEWLELNAFTYPSFLGSSFSFSGFRLNLRTYISFLPEQVLALQAVITAQSGAVPFQKLAQLGGENLLRGYFAGRFRDKNLVALQAEYRLHLVWRFGAVAFAGMGEVGDRWHSFQASTIKYAGGFGLRFRFDKKEKIQIRADMGFGKGSSGFYFSIFEAF